MCPALNLGSPAVPAANPSTGQFVLMSPFSGPKGSPFDAMVYPPSVNASTINAVKVADPTNFSTGGLSTGIGFGANHTINPTAPRSISDASFTDDYIPGVTFPDGVTPATDSRFVAIGGGRSGPNVGGIAPTNMYNAQPLLGFGNGASRDGGAGPAFTGFGTKMVTAIAVVANGAAIEAGFTNRSGFPMAIGQSAFGSDAAASQAVA